MWGVGHRTTHHSLLVTPISKQTTVFLLLLVSLILFLLSTFILFGIEPTIGAVQPRQLQQLDNNDGRYVLSDSR